LLARLARAAALTRRHGELKKSPHLSGTAVLVSLDLELLQRSRQVTLVVPSLNLRASRV